MRYPQLLVFERDGRLAWLLKDICAAHRWTCREPRQTEACLRLLRSGGPTLLVVRTTSKPARDQPAEDAEQEQKTIERSFTLLDRAHWLRPDAAIIAVGERDDPAMTALAWNLGATYVLAPPQSLGILPDLVGHMMGSLTRSVPPESVSGEEQT
jgi:hypothetical protein